MRVLVQNKYIHILQAGPKKRKKKEGLLFLHQIIQTRRVDSPVMKWDQIHARGEGMSPGASLRILFY